MKRSGRYNLRVRILTSAIVVMLGASPAASAVTLDSVLHIHHLKVVGNKVLIPTHEGLFELVGKNDMKLVGEDKFDVMGFTTLGKDLFASGHPAQGSAMPNPIGLLKSKDGGLNWQAISLVGKVDFHLLEGAKSDLYGADSQSGNLMYSADSGKTWSSLGINTFTDIAISPEVPGTAIALKNSKLLLTKNAFKTTSKIKNSLKFTQIEWRNSELFALSGTTLYKSSNSGKTWKNVSKFKAATGILSVSDQMMLVTVGSDIFTSKNDGRSFRKIS